MRTCLILLAVTLALGCKKKEEIDDTAMTGTTIDAGDPGEAEVAAELDAPEEEEAPRVAVAKLTAAKGKKVTGTVTFREEDGKVTVTANIEGLSAGQHGFHVHQNGTCDQPDFKSAGDHFSADPSHPHAAPTETPRHTGDLGNIEAKKGEAVEHSMDSDLITLGEGPNSIIGKAVIVHEKADDLKTQPSGNAGGRIACGVIEMSEETGMAPGTDAGAAGAEEHGEGDGHAH